MERKSESPSIPERRPYRRAALIVIPLLLLAGIAGSRRIGGHATGDDQAAGGCGGSPVEEAVGSQAGALTTPTDAFSANAAADTFVQRDNSGPYGDLLQLYVNNRGASANTRKSLIRFNVPNVAMVSARLCLDVSTESNSTGGSTNATFYVWGIKDASDASCGESFSPTVLYNDLPFLDDSGDGVVDDSPCLHDGDPAQAGVQPLYAWPISAANLNQTACFNNAALADFLTANTNGIVTLVFTRAEYNANLNTAFASSEHTSLHGPRLTWAPKELVQNGGFETSAAPWVKSGTAYYHPGDSDQSGGHSQSGTGYISFVCCDAQGNDGPALMATALRGGEWSQTIAIPTLAAGSLSFWINISRIEFHILTGYDHLWVDVLDTSGTLLQTLEHWTDADYWKFPCSAAPCFSYAKKTYDLSAYRGQTIRLRFRHYADQAYSTFFRIDDVSLQ